MKQSSKQVVFYRSEVIWPNSKHLHDDKDGVLDLSN